MTRGTPLTVDYVPLRWALLAIPASRRLHAAVDALLRLINDVRFCGALLAESASRRVHTAVDAIGHVLLLQTLGRIDAHGLWVMGIPTLSTEPVPV